MSTTPSLSRSAAAGEHLPVWQIIAHFPRPVWCILVGMFLNRFGTFVIPFLVLHVARLGYPVGYGGLALGAYGAGHLIASALGGHLADTLGRRRTIVASLFGGAVTMLALSQAHGFGALVALAFLNGVAGEMYRPASTAMLADQVGEAQRVTVFAAYRFAINAGFAFGPAVAGLLARHSYFWLFVGNAAASLLYAAIAVFFLPRDPARLQGGAREVLNAFGSIREALQAAGHDARFVRLLLATLAVGMGFMQVFSTLGVEIKNAGFSDQVYGLVLSLNGLLVALFEIPLTSFTRRVSPRPIMAAGFVLTGCGAGLFAWASLPWHYALGMGILTLGEILSMPVALAYVVKLAPEAMRGRYLGVYGLTWALALTVGPSLGTAVFAWHRTALWLGCWGLSLLGALLTIDGHQRAARLESAGLPTRT